MNKTLSCQLEVEQDNKRKNTITSVETEGLPKPALWDLSTAMFYCQ